MSAQAHDCSNSQRTLQQVQAYLSYNLTITTQLIDTTRARLSLLENVLETPTSHGKSRRSLKKDRNKALKRLHHCQSEAEMLTRALDEVKAKIVLAELGGNPRSLSVFAQPNCASYITSPTETSSQRSSSIGSYINSDFSPLPQFPYSASTPYFFSQNVSPYPNLTQGLPSATLYSLSPYTVFFPYAFTPYTVYQQDPWFAMTELAWYHDPSYPIPAETWQSAAPTTFPVDPTTWNFQQSPISDTQTVLLSSLTSPKRMRRYSSPTTNSLSSRMKSNTQHKRGRSSCLDEVLKAWDESMSLGDDGQDQNKNF